MREISVWLSRYFQKRLPPAAAEDATQEALLAIHVHKQRYDPSDPMRPWLKTIARFKWIDQLRSHLRSPESLDDMDVPVEDHGGMTRASNLCGAAMVCAWIQAMGLVNDRGPGYVRVSDLAPS